MPIAHNPFSITYGTFEVGGTVGGSGTTGHYMLHGPYHLEKSPERLSLTFDVMVVGNDYEDLQSLSDTLETSYRTRDADIVINIDQGNTDAKWTYTSGSTIGNTRGTARKSGNPETDRGLSRLYTVTLEGELPADDAAGLRSMEVTTQILPSKQKIVTISGHYQIANASSVYSSNRDANDSTLLDAIDSTYSWELTDEVFTRDRVDGNVRFQRQYTQLLSNQAVGQTDSNKIVSHTCTFSEQSPGLGDMRPNLHQLHRVTASFDCAFDVDNVSPTQAGNMQSTFENTVRPLVLDIFKKTFKPKVFGIEDQRASYDESGNNFSCELTIVFQPKDAAQVVKVDQSLRYREVRTIDQTPVHSGGEFAVYTDPGWAVRERVWTRTVVVIGDQVPQHRIATVSTVGAAGFFDSVQGADGVETLKVSAELQTTGWNIVSNESEVTPHYIGLPNVKGAGKQIKVTMLRETVVERYGEAPSGTSKVKTI